MSAVDSVKARDNSQLGTVNGVPASEAWGALINPTPRMQLAPTVHGIEECIKDTWMPLVHPGLLASGEYEGQTFLQKRHVPRPSDAEFREWLRNPDKEDCYQGRRHKVEVACHGLGVRRTVLNQYIYQNAAQPGVLTRERHGIDASRPYTGWLYPLADNDASLKRDPPPPL